MASLLGTQTKARVIYDGECGVCQALRHWVQRQDIHHRLDFIPYQIALWGDISSLIPPDQMQEALFLISEEGKIYRGAYALGELLKRLTGFWKGVGLGLTVLPFYLFLEPLYRFFARHRHWFSRIGGLQCHSCRHSSFHKAR